MEQSSFW